MQPSAVDSRDYAIRDIDLGLDTVVPKTWLEDPNFDLVSWYQQHLDELGLFEQRYYETHRNMLLQKEKSNDQQNKCCHPMHDSQKCAEQTHNSLESINHSSIPESSLDWDELTDLESIITEDSKNRGEFGSTHPMMNPSGMTYQD